MNKMRSMIVANVAVPLLALRVLASPVDPSSTNGAGFGKLLPKERVQLSGDWVPLGVPDPNTLLNLQIGLKQKDIAGALAKLLDVSDPDSPNYGNWLSQDEVNAFIAPEVSTVSAVKQWLSSNGIDSKAISQSTPDWLQVSLPLQRVESLLSTKYSLFGHPNLSGLSIPRALSYSLPESLHGLIDTIQPTTALINPFGPGLDQGAKSLTSEALEKRATQCDPGNLTPNCLKAYYQVDYTPKNRKGAQVASAGIGGASASHSDARLYYKALTNNNVDFVDVTINSSPRQSGKPGLEGNLDTQLTGGIAKGNQAYYLNLGNPHSDPFIDLVNYLSANNTGASPAVSISYGANENALSGDYLDRVCHGFATAGLKGISVFVASGDSGISGNNDPSKSCSKFVPVFPADCPYVTAVGGTDFKGGKKFPVGSSSTTEEAAYFGSDGGTGGGFSNHFKLASWQNTDVQNYIKSLDGKYKGEYNASGRAYPDVSALAQSWKIFLNGSAISGVYGTSASAPAWAALVSILNDYRVSKGKKTLGFLNPALYGKLRKGIRDVTGRGTRGCNSAGFPANKGWDAATGLGSPIFKTLRANV